jgi:hypothetical protein
MARVAQGIATKTKRNAIVTAMSILQDLLKDSAYKLTQFTTDQIKALENGITVNNAVRQLPCPQQTNQTHARGSRQTTVRDGAAR